MYFEREHRFHMKRFPIADNEYSQADFKSKFAQTSKKPKLKQGPSCVQESFSSVSDSKSNDSQCFGQISVNTSTPQLNDLK